MASKYPRVPKARTPDPMNVVKLPADLIEKVDAWGIGVGQPSRTAAIRELLDRALKAAAAETARV